MVCGINLGCVNILLQRDIIFFIPVGWFHNCVIKRALASEVFLGQWWALIGQMILCGDERNRAREFFLTQCFGGLGSGQAATNNDNIFLGYLCHPPHYLQWAVGSEVDRVGIRHATRVSRV